MVESPAFEGLRNYIVGGGGRPVDVRAFDQRGVRQSMSLPNGAVPDVQNQIPTSSARPFKMTNQRIVYARVQTAFAKSCGSIDRTPVREGDAVFVHRCDAVSAVGHDTNKTSRVATLVQLNNILNSYSGAPGGDSDIVMPIHDGAGNPYNPRGKDRDDYVRERGVAPGIAEQEWDGGMIDRVRYRWEHCRSLGQWTPDGILASTEHECVMDHSNPGEVYNIAIGGPTLMRNAAAGDFPQHFDDGARTLDKVFIGLIATEVRDKDGKGVPLHWSFKYKLFTSRQLMWSELGNPQSGSRINAAHAGGYNRLGPTPDEFLRMVQVWRTGSVLDTQSGVLPYKCVTLNVVVEEWTMDRLAAEYNSQFASSPRCFTLATPAEEMTAAELLDKARDIVEYNAMALDAVYSAFSSLNLSHLDVVEAEAHLKHWSDVESAYTARLTAAGGTSVPLPDLDMHWSDVESAYTARLTAAGGTSVPLPDPDIQTRNYHGDVTGPRSCDAPLYYKPASKAIVKLLDAFEANTAATKVFTSSDAWAVVGRAMALADKLSGAAWLWKIEVAHDRYLQVGRLVQLGAKIADRPNWLKIP